MPRDEWNRPGSPTPWYARYDHVTEEEKTVTYKQVRYLVRLGCDEHEARSMSRTEASRRIDELKGTPRPDWEYLD